MTKKSPYNRKWQRAREAFLQKHPLCVFCKAQGYTTAATVVDHIIPHKGDYRLFWDEKNFQSLCATHHASTKQSIENGKQIPYVGLDGWNIE